MRYKPHEFEIGQTVRWAKVGEAIKKGTVFLVDAGNQKLVVEGTQSMYVVPMDEVFGIGGEWQLIQTKP